MVPAFSVDSLLSCKRFGLVRFAVIRAAQRHGRFRLLSGEVSAATPRETANLNGAAMEGNSAS